MSYLLGFIAFILKLCVLLYASIALPYGGDSEEEMRERKLTGIDHRGESGCALTIFLTAFWLGVGYECEWSQVSIWLAIFFTAVLSHLWGDYKRQFWDQ